MIEINICRLFISKFLFSSVALEVCKCLFDLVHREIFSIGQSNKSTCWRSILNLSELDILHGVLLKLCLKLKFARKLAFFTNFWQILPQSENFRIFLSIRFYVKSILKILEVLKLPFWPFFGALNFDYYEFLHYLKAEINQIESTKNDIFRTSRFSKVDFT